MKWVSSMREMGLRCGLTGGSTLDVGLRSAWDLGGVGRRCGRNGSMAWVNRVGQLRTLVAWEGGVGR